MSPQCTPKRGCALSWYLEGQRWLADGALTSMQPSVACKRNLDTATFLELCHTEALSINSRCTVRKTSTTASYAAITRLTAPIT